MAIPKMVWVSMENTAQLELVALATMYFHVFKWGNPVNMELNRVPCTTIVTTSTITHTHKRIHTMELLATVKYLTALLINTQHHPVVATTTVETRYNVYSRDPKNSYVITSCTLYALQIAFILRTGT